MAQIVHENDTLLRNPSGAVSPKLMFGDADTYVYESADDVLDLYVAGSIHTRFNASSLDHYLTIKADHIGEHTASHGIVFDNELSITGTDKQAGFFYAGTTTPDSITRLNYDGYFYATRLYYGSQDMQPSISGNRFDVLAYVDNSGQTHVGSTIDFHHTDGGTIYDNRIASGAGGFTFSGLIKVSNMGGDANLNWNYLEFNVSSVQRLYLVPNIADSGSNVAYIFDTHNALTSGRKLMSVRNQGTEKMYIDYNGDVYVNGTKLGSQWTTSGSDIYYTTGNVGIGTTAPVNKEDINIATAVAAATSGSASNGNLRLSASNTVLILDSGVMGGGSAHAWLQSRDSTNYAVNYNLALNPNGGYVGIGTAVPAAKLEVVDAAAGQAIFSGYTVVGAAARAGSGSIQLGHTSTYAGRLDYTDAGQTVLYLDNTYDSAAAKMQFRMRTAGTPVNAITILGSGYIGIGTISPNRALEISVSDAVIRLNRLNSTDYGSNVEFTTNGTQDWVIGTRGISNSDFQIYSFGTSTNVVTISRSTGYVGIGTSPSSPLHVLFAGASGTYASYINNSSSTSGQGLGLQIVAGSTSSDISFNIMDRTATYYRFQVRGDGAVSVGTTPSSTYLFYVAGHIYSTDNMYADDFIQTSDQRLKRDILLYEPKYIDIDYKQFRLKDNDQLRYGAIAQELEVKHPEFIRNLESGMKSISYIDLLICEIAYLKDKVKELEGRIN